MAGNTTNSSTKRPLGSSVLWAHLLRKDVSTASLPSLTNNTIAPADKAGTSMRILLHDTQANLEKFSARVDKLATGVEETKREMVTLKTLFSEEHEKLIEDIVNLLNRCQNTLQSCLGSPAQASELEDVHKNLISKDLKLEALDKKFDVLHMLNQTQSQALQSIQDQQFKLISSLTPVLPLLQAIPLHVDAAKNDVKEVIRTVIIEPLAVQAKNAALAISPEHTFKQQGQGRKRHSSSTIVGPESEAPSSSPFGDGSISMPLRKKPRLDDSPADRCVVVRSSGSTQMNNYIASVSSAIPATARSRHALSPHRQSVSRHKTVNGSPSVSISNSKASSNQECSPVALANITPNQHEQRQTNLPPVFPFSADSAINLNTHGRALLSETLQTSRHVSPANITDLAQQKNALVTATKFSPSRLSAVGSRAPSLARTVALTPTINRRPTDSRLIHTTSRTSSSRFFSRTPSAVLSRTLTQNQVFTPGATSGTNINNSARPKLFKRIRDVTSMQPQSGLQQQHGRFHGLEASQPAQPVFLSLNIPGHAGQSSRVSQTILRSSTPSLGSQNRSPARLPGSPQSDRSALFPDRRLKTLARGCSLTPVVVSGSASGQMQRYTEQQQDISIVEGNVQSSIRQNRTVALLDSDQDVSIRQAVTPGPATDMGMTKPMSLKDRKAHEVSIFKPEGKRFIPLDDIDDEDGDSSFG